MVRFIIGRNRANDPELGRRIVALQPGEKGLDLQGPIHAPRERTRKTQAPSASAARIVLEPIRVRLPVSRGQYLVTPLVAILLPWDTAANNVIDVSLLETLC